MVNPMTERFIDALNLANVFRVFLKNRLNELESWFSNFEHDPWSCMPKIVRSS